MNFDRHSQYDKCTDLQTAARDTRIADDVATTAMATQQATVDGLVRKITALYAKTQPWGGPTDQDYIDYGQAKIWLKTEAAKLQPLIDAQEKTKVASDVANQAWIDAVMATRQNPGAIEQV